MVGNIGSQIRGIVNGAAPNFAVFVAGRAWTRQQEPAHAGAAPRWAKLSLCVRRLVQGDARNIRAEISAGSPARRCRE